MFLKIDHWTGAVYHIDLDKAIASGPNSKIIFPKDLYLPLFGLVFDILGALQLAKSLIFKKIKDIAKESSSHLGSNPYLEESLIKQRIEAQVGGTCMVVGFILQILTYIIKLKSIIVITLGLILLFILLWIVILIIVKKVGDIQISKLKYGELFMEIENNERNYPKQVTGQLTSWGKRCGLTKNEQESDEQFLQRIKQFLAKVDKYKKNLISFRNWEDPGTKTSDNVES